MAQFGILQDACQTEKAEHEIAFGHHLAIGHKRPLGEKRLHQVVKVHVLFRPLVVGSLHGRRLFVVAECRVGLVHVVHVMFGRVVGDAQARVEPHQLLQGILHGEDAADDDGRLGIDAHRIGKHLREAFIHSAGYLPMLSGPQRSEFAPTVFRLFIHHAYAAQHIAARGGEHTGAVGMFKQADGTQILAAANEVAGTVAAVVAQIEWLIARRSGGQPLLHGAGIGHMIAGGETMVAADFITRTLGADGQGQTKGNEKQTDFLHTY